MLRFITGRAGSGKTYYIKHKIEEQLSNNTDIVLIIPEQSSFEYERNFLQFLGDENYAKLQIFSFTRLAHFINQNTVHTKPAIDSFGKTILMYRAVNASIGQLQLYARQTNDISFIQSLISIAGEFKNSSVSPDDILALSNRINSGIFKQKLFEISIILHNYYYLLNESFTDPSDDLERLNDLLNEYRFFEHKTVYLDGFNGFTGSELKIISCILQQSDETNITLLTDNESSLFADDLSLFCPVKKTARMIYDIAKKNGISVALPVKLNTQYRFKNHELTHLEQNLFSPAPAKYDGECSAVQIYKAIGSFDEVEFAAKSIAGFVRNDGMRYRDIAVIARNIDQYADILEVVFKKYNIPLFMDTRESIDCTPLFTFILSLLEIAAYGYDSDAIFRILKTDLLSFSPDDISALENYCITWNITGNKWLSDFTGHPDGLGFLMDENAEQTLNELNRLRCEIIEPLHSFRQSIADATGDIITTKLYELLCSYNIQANLSALAEKYSKNGQTQLAEEQDRLWNLYCDMSERCVQILKGIKIPLKEYYDLFRLTVENASIGQIPIMFDCVSAGSADRIQPHEPKAVIILGANDGVFPANDIHCGLLSTYERSLLASLDREISDSPEMVIAKERLLCYNAMSYPSERLYISTQKIDLVGESKLPSAIVEMCYDMFSDDITIEYDNNSPLSLFTDEQAFQTMTACWHQNSDLSAALKQYFLTHPQYSDKYRSLCNITSKNPNIANVEQGRIFDNNITLSASRIEAYYNCRYQYFCKYILNAYPRPDAKLDSRHFGTILHYVLEQILKINGKDGFVNLSSDQIGAQVDRIINDYVEAYMGSTFDKPARFNVLLKRWSNNCKLIAVQLRRELSQSDFTPTDFELKIGADIKPLAIKADDDTEIYIIGSIDRVDTMKSGDCTYLRIIDYKSGKKQFKLSDLLEGLNMQMLIYLIAIKSTGTQRYGNIVPCGILYMPSNAASVYRCPDTDTALDSIGTGLKMNGMLLDDSKALLSMEKDGGGKFIPLKLNEDGTVKMTEKSYASSPFYSNEEFDFIQRYVTDKIKQMAFELKSGNISPNPKQSNNRSFCSFCEYADICDNSRQTPYEAPALSHRAAMEIIAGGNKEHIKYGDFAERSVEQ